MRYLIIFILIISFSCEDKNPVTGTSSESKFVKTDNSWLNDTSETINDVNSSMQKWSSLKEEYGNTYKYYHSSYYWPDIYYDIYVLVESNKVCEALRIYSKSVVSNGKSILEPFDTLYTSLDSNISQLSNFKTVDELYKITTDSILSQNPDSNKIEITFHNTGLLKHCYYWDYLVQDAVNKEVQIDSLFFGEIK